MGAQLRGEALVTLWYDDKSVLVSASVGPDSAVDGDYAYAKLKKPTTLKAGKEYRLSQQCSSGMPDYWFDGVVTPAELATGCSLADYRGSVYCDGVGYPDKSDNDSRYPPHCRRAGMLNMLMKKPKAPGSPKSSQGPPKSSVKTQRPDRLAIRFVCMS